MSLLKKLLLIFLILLLAIIALKIALPMLIWAFKTLLTVVLLALVVIGIIYLYGKLKSA